MSLQNSLYYVVRSDDAGYTVRFDASHPIFAGHFPDHPVVPGACLVQVAEELTALTIGRPVRFTALKNLKFRQPVTPDRELTISLQDNNPSINFQLSTFNINCASFTATYMCLDTDVQ